MKSTRAGVVFVVVVAGLWPRSLKHFSLGFELGTAAVRNSNEQKLINPHENGCGKGSRVFCSVLLSTLSSHSSLSSFLFLPQQGVYHPPSTLPSTGPIYPCLLCVFLLNSYYYPGHYYYCCRFCCRLSQISFSYRHVYIVLYLYMYRFFFFAVKLPLIYGRLFLSTCRFILLRLRPSLQFRLLPFVACARSCCLSFACIMIAVAIVHSRCYCCSHSCCHCRCCCRCCRAIVHFNPQTG